MIKLQRRALRWTMTEATLEIYSPAPTACRVWLALSRCSRITNPGTPIVSIPTLLQVCRHKAQGTKNGTLASISTRFVLHLQCRISRERSPLDFPFFQIVSHPLNTALLRDEFHQRRHARA